MEVNDLLAAAETIKNENSINKNSSNRIGVMLENMINFFSTTISPAAAALIQDAVSKSTTGVRKGMSVVWSGAIAEIPAGYVLSNGNNGQPINGVVVPDYRSRFLIGYDSSKASFPINGSDTTENYGKAGNTGGEATHKLIVAEIPAHKHRILGNAGNDQSNTPGREMGINGTDYGNTTENAGGDQAHENRPPYYVVYWITKVSDDTTAEYNSAYQSYKATTTDVPVKTEAEWIETLKGEYGKSAYQSAVDGGFNGTEVQFSFMLNNISTIQYDSTQVVNGSIILDKNIKLYKISTATALNISINTSTVDLTKYLNFILKINLNDYVSLTFPSKFLFANLDYPTETGEYVYNVASSDGGATWRLELLYKNIATVGLDQNGNEIIGSVIRYVDGNLGSDANNGLTWATAYKNVQPAIDISNSGDVVFIKGSLVGITYIPTKLSSIGVASSASFILKSGVSVFGGFLGTERTLYEREMVSYKETLRLPSGVTDLFVSIPKYISILSGDLLGNKTSLSSIVVTGSNSTCVLNGFNITGGGNVVNNRQNIGVSGISSTFLTSCKIYNCDIVSIGSCTYNNCILENNIHSGLYCEIATLCNGSKILNSIIRNNSVINGGDYSNYNFMLNSCIIINSTVYNNNTEGYIIRYGTTNNTDINNNISNLWTTMYAVELTNSTLRNNNSNGPDRPSSTGSAYSCTLNSCLVFNNTGRYGCISSCSATSCSIFNNSTTNLGAGAYLSTLVNCSVVRNSGGGTYNCILKNTVVWGNKSTAGTTNNVVNTNSSVETYSAFENEVRTGAGNISLSVNNEGDATSPYFTTISVNPGVVDDTLASVLTLKLSTLLSFLIDKGNNADNLTGYGSVFDMVSNTRKCGIIDIGACEFQK